MKISIASYSFHGLIGAGMMDVFGYLEACKHRYGLDAADFWNGLLGRDDKEMAAIEEMTRAFKDIGAETIVFDQLHPTAKSWVNPLVPKLMEVSGRSGLTVLEVGKLLSTHPERGRFVCLDGIHMTPPYHKLMAGELLKYFVGVRKAKLAEE